MRNRPTRQRANALTIFFLSLMLSGCSASYTGERLFWKAQQLSSPVLKDPSHATPEQVAGAIGAFDRVLLKAPGTVWAGRAQLAIGSVYAMQQQYSRAREAYALVLQNYHQHQELCLGARVSTAQTYEAEESWEQAEQLYKDISDYHPWTTLGLEAPLYLAAMHEKRDAPDEATHAYERAVRLYSKLIPDAPTPELATHLKGYLALVYQRLGDWDQAIKVLETLATTTTEANRPLVLLTLGSIYQSKLHDSEQAEAAYTKLIEEFPEHQFGKVAKAQLERLVTSPSATPAAR